MRILLVEPYYSGSHKAWADGYAQHSVHEVVVMSHEARFWRWRMQGSALTLAEQLDEVEGEFDAVMASDMLDLAAFLGHARRRLGSIPAVLYMHENQLSYPLSEALAEDLTYANINWRSMAAADAVWFNSEFHRADVAKLLPEFLGRFPDRRHTDLVDGVLDRTSVHPVGVDLSELGGDPVRNQRPLIMWNHRWEHDKAPEVFLEALDALVDRGLDFDVALAGENFRQHPAEFSAARDRLGDRVVRFGYAPRDEYVELLKRSSIVVSTALHEFFGISLTEAVYAGAFPVLPDRLVYPERIPSEFHDACLYETGDGLIDRLAWAIEHPQAADETAGALRPTMAEFDWSNVAPRYDAAIEALTQ